MAAGQQLAFLEAQQLALATLLQNEGVLSEQFTELMQLQDESNPGFVAEVIQLFWEDSGTKIDRIGILATGSPVDWVELDGLVHQFKGSSASLGAETITRLCIKLREMCQAQNQLACVHLQQEILQAYRVLQSKLGVFMELEAQRRTIYSMTAQMQPQQQRYN